MSQGYRKVRIFIASPGDVAAERDRLRDVIEELDHALGDPLGVVLRPLDWHDVPPGMGRPQQVIFNQLSPETWDIFVGILWHRFGTPPGAGDPLTGKPFSAGTEEEFTQAYRLWKEQGQPRILIYRCTRAIPPDKLDPEQFTKVRAFFNAFSADGAHPGLAKSFKSTNDFERSVRRDLGNILRDMFTGAAKPKPPNPMPSATAGDAAGTGSVTPRERPVPPPSGLADTYDDGLDDQIQALEAQVEAARRQINALAIKKAKMGISTDAATIIEIEDNERAQIAAMGQIVAIRSERAERLKGVAGGAQAALLTDAQRALLDDTIRQKSMELRMQERKATDFGGSRTPYDGQIAALKGQIHDLRRQRDALGK